MRMIRLHYYSNSVGLRLSSLVDEEVYRIDEIKEFPRVDPAWKDHLAQLLQGLFYKYNNSYSFYFIVKVFFSINLSIINFRNIVC